MKQKKISSFINNHDFVVDDDVIQKNPWLVVNITVYLTSFTSSTDLIYIEIFLQLQQQQQQKNI